MPFSKCLRAKMYCNMNVHSDPQGCQTLLLKESEPLFLFLGSWNKACLKRYFKTAKSVDFFFSICHNLIPLCNPVVQSNYTKWRKPHAKSDRYWATKCTDNSGLVPVVQSDYTKWRKNHAKTYRYRATKCPDFSGLVRKNCVQSGRQKLFPPARNLPKSCKIML